MSVSASDSSPDWPLALATTLRLLPLSEVVRPVEYRCHAYCQEQPGGGIEPGESVADAAARELAEESGFIGEIEVVGSTWSAGNATRKCWVAVATQCRPVCEQRLDDAEQIEVVLRDLDDFRDQLRAGELTDSAHGYRGLEYLGLL